jgi:hypothetical protein
MLIFLFGLYVTSFATTDYKLLEQPSPHPRTCLTDWKEIQTVDDVCNVFPDRMETLLQQINLDFPGLENVKKAYEEKQIKRACQLLLDYFRKDATAAYFRIEEPPVTQTKNADGELIVQNICTFYNQEAKVPYTADGHIDWSFHGPTNDMEWAWALNRHYPIRTLFDAYLATGNPLYAETIDLHLKDWIIASLPYPAKNSNTEMWRGLEVHSRVKIWAKAFYALNNTAYLSPATQLLVLSSLPEHAHYLRNFHAGGNWLTMELSALATVATAWPQFKESPQWFQYSVATMTKSLEEQVYPDGVQKELSSSYHTVAMSNFSSLLDICEQAKRPLPDNYGKYMENMWNYLACTIRPDGHGLLNNDSDLSDNRETVQKSAERYRRADWKYIVSNGEEGIQPDGGPSFFFPWAGHLITRSGYDPAAQWAFFDMGPWGTGHQHNDKLHISVSAYGHDFLVDAGRFSYNGEVADKFRRYACGSAGHNLILIDGKGQAPGPAQVKEPLADNYFKITDQFDYGWNSFNQFIDVEGVCEHTRAFFYVRGKCWVVIDKLATDCPRTIETLWHWHPKCTVNVDNKQIVSAQHKDGFLHVIPVGATQWSVSCVKGQEMPSIQGWYSREYNEYEPAITSIFTTSIHKETNFVWILYPSEKQSPDIKVKVISENSNGLIIRIDHSKEGRWTLNIPFTDSRKASMIKK